MNGFEVGDLIVINCNDPKSAYCNAIFKISEKYPNNVTRIECVKSNHYFQLCEILTFFSSTIRESFIKFKAKKSEDIISEWI